MHMRQNKQALCNTCGVPESKWVDDMCWECKQTHTHCRMEPSVVLEQRTYNWLVKHRLSGSVLYPLDLIPKVEKLIAEGKHVPVHVRAYIEREKQRRDTGA